MAVGSLCDGARRFPLLARAGAHPWAGFAALRALAARVWFAGRSFSRATAAPRSLQFAQPRRTGRFQETILQARRKRAGPHAAHRPLPLAQLDRARISADAATNLRSAGNAVRARRRADFEPAEHRDGGHAASHAVRNADGRAAGARAGGAWPDRG